MKWFSSVPTAVDYPFSALDNQGYPNTRVPVAKMTSKTGVSVPTGTCVMGTLSRQVTITKEYIYPEGAVNGEHQVNLEYRNIRTRGRDARD